MKMYLPRSNEDRIKKAFLFFPKKINREIRWLCIAEWEELYNEWHEEWRAIRWVN